MDLKEIVSKNVKRIRKEKKISQKKLAESSGIYKRYFSQIENEAPNLTLDSLQNIAEGLGVPVQDLVTPLEQKIKANGLTKNQKIDYCIDLIRSFKD